MKTYEAGWFVFLYNKKN